MALDVAVRTPRAGAGLHGCVSGLIVPRGKMTVGQLRMAIDDRRPSSQPDRDWGLHARQIHWCIQIAHDRSRPLCSPWSLRASLAAASRGDAFR